MSGILNIKTEKGKWQKQETENLSLFLCILNSNIHGFIPPK